MKLTYCSTTVRRLAVLAIGIVVITRHGETVQAGEPLEVRFDCGPAIVCRDVTPETFAASNPDEKIVEATLRISARVADGTAADLRELVYEVQSPGKRARVSDFSPKTVLASEMAAPILIVKTKDKHQSLGAMLGGTVAAPGPIEAKAAPSATIGRSRHDGVREEMQKIPAKKPVIISGTSHHEHGVFFKFKSSSQTSLEGVQELTCQFIVPRNWRGDWLLLACQATGVRTRYLIKGLHPCGEARFVMGLYLEGDTDAKDAAQQLAGAQLSPKPAAGASDVSRLRAASDHLRTYAGDL